MILQSYKNIPGQLVEFKDGGMVLRNNSTTDRSTKSMLILGTAKDGPKDPVAIDIDTVEYLYGKDVNANGVPNGATIPKAVNEAYRSGCRDIRTMRITGENAIASINNVEKSINEVNKVEETLGYAEGNDETVVTLGNDGVIEDTLRMYVKGDLISTTFVYVDATKSLTIPADVTDAGVNFTLRYDYLKTETGKSITDVKTLDSNKKITLSQTPKATITVKDSEGSTLTLTTDYTVSGKDVTFLTKAAGDTVTVTYTADVVTRMSAVENGAGSVPFKTESGEQSFSLEAVPMDGTFHIYSNDGEVLATDACTVNAVAKTAAINKERFPKGAAISVSYFTSTTVTRKETIGFESVYAGSVYNDGSIEVVNILNKDSIVIGKKVIITKPEEKRTSSEVPLEYLSSDYPTFAQLVDAINRDNRNGVYKARTDYGDAATSALEAKKVLFNGGDDGLNVSKIEMFEKLSGKRDANGFLIKEGVYQLLENYSVDEVVLVGVYADDILPGRYDMFDYELALFCAVISHQSKTTFGYMELTPCKDTSLKGISEYADKLATWNMNRTRYLMKVNGKVYTDQDGNPIDLGKFIRIVAGPDMLFMSDTLGVHYGYNAVAMAAFQTSLPSQSSPTNKKIPGTKGLRYRFSKPQLDKITGASIITFMQKFDNRGNLLEGAYCVDSMSSSLPGSDYYRTTTGEVIRDCVDDIREVSDPYLGEPTTVEKKNALAAAISKRLGIRKEQGVILDYTFQIVANATDNVIGRCRIELTIVPPQELRQITTVVGLSPTL